MKYFVLLIAFFNFYANTLFAQKISAQICTWQDNKPAAVSITFDDASYTQYEFAYPTLSKYHYKATYSLVGVWTKEQPAYSSEPGIFKIKKMGWAQIKDLHRNGNEIASHGYRHQRYGKNLPLDTLISQMKKAKKLIENHLQDSCYTLHYPYSFTSEKISLAAQKAGFKFGRTGGNDYNDANPENMFLLKSKAILNNTNPSLPEFDRWLKDAKGKWLILMYHHLFPDDSKEMKILRYHLIENTYSLLPETFDKQIENLSHYDYWVAPVKTVGTYIKERQDSKLRMHRFCHRIWIKLKSNSKFEDAVPLSIIIKLPWKKVLIKQTGKKEYRVVENGQLLLKLLPGHKLMIKKVS